uniref:ASPIC/UnbV domain-containing protein n=1 Tax=Chaetoceros debilis TaxID=122233 RepID=A0A7S3QGS3_9STRA
MMFQRVIILFAIFHGSSVFNNKRNNLVSAQVFDSSNEEFQPTVVTVESYPSRRLLNAVSLPEGSIWCDGKPTYWLVGHQKSHESPWCLTSTNESEGTRTDFSAFYDLKESTWEMNNTTALDDIDVYPDHNGKNIDRHGCIAMDLNNDGVHDLVCGVGAGKGRSQGFNEVYITQKEENSLGSRGSLVKIDDGRGLQKFKSMRNRFIKPLKGNDGSQLLFLATKGTNFGSKNQHRMFRLVPDDGPYGFHFDHVSGPWIRFTKASCLQTVDFNSDGVDDIIMCNEDGHPAFVFLQGHDGSDKPWTRMGLGRLSKKWTNVRLYDIDGDEINDLIVVQDNKINIYKGQKEYPFFSFNKENRLLHRKLLYPAPDVEIIDANQDGWPDIYVVQSDSSKPNSDEIKYCGTSHRDPAWKEKYYNTHRPTDDWTPPKDTAPDILFLGSASGKFTRVEMKHSEPGCGFLVERFGNNRTLILGQGNMGREGHNLLLQW